MSAEGFTPCSASSALFMSVPSVANATVVSKPFVRTVSSCGELTRGELFKYAYNFTCSTSALMLD
jgi:hypothetical protein